MLYLEEFLEDEPEHPRRQLLLQLEPAAEAAARGARAPVRLRRAARAGRTSTTARSWPRTLLWRDLISVGRLRLHPDARAATSSAAARAGTSAATDSAGTPRYLDYQLVIGEDLYWYRRRAFRESDGQLQQEVIGFNRFEPNEARLYACRVAWSASGAPRELRPLSNLELYEAGGHGRFVTPDGRAFLLTLHGRDWPFALDRDALILLLQEEGREDARSPRAWAQMDAQQVALQLGWLEVRCGSLAPDSDELTQ